MSPEIPDPEPETQSPRAGGSRRPGPFAITLVILWDLIGGLALLGYFFFLNTGARFEPLDAEYLRQCAAPSPYAADEPAARKAMARAEKTLKKVMPSKVFIAIDRVHNHLYLREGDTELLDAVISCGAGSILEDPSGKRTWVFDTPIGRFRVVNKRERPVWTAPDWEYIESNEPIPTRRSERVQEGMLGEYALDLNASGYMIHGTLYSRLLGRNVSHGCIRVGRDDLRVIWKKAPIGTTVFIY